MKKLDREVGELLMLAKCQGKSIDNLTSVVSLLKESASKGFEMQAKEQIELNKRVTKNETAIALARKIAVWLCGGSITGGLIFKFVAPIFVGG